MKVEPKVTPHTGIHKNEERETHPAYGQIGITRVQGHAKLYGSVIENHGTFICIKIRHSEVHHHLGKNWFHSRGNIIEVHLSPAQFAEFITTPNMGEGVPCTISRLGNKSVPGITAAKTEVQKIVGHFITDQAEFVEELATRVAEALGIVNKKGVIYKGDRETLRGLLEWVEREVIANRPFAVESFQRAAERVVTAGKAEVEAFVMSALTRLGLTKLDELHALAAHGELPKSLPEPTTKEQP